MAELAEIRITAAGESPMKLLFSGPTELIACPDCGMRQLLGIVPRGWQAKCLRCGKLLARPETARAGASLALFCAALLLWLPACVEPLMAVSTNGAVRQSELASGIGALWSAGFPSLALIVAAFSMAVPSLYLALVITVLVGVGFPAVLGRSRSEGPSPLGRLYRWSLALRSWAMIEVYLLGACIAYSRIQKVAFVSVGTAAWCLVGASFCWLLADAVLDDRAVWQAVPVGAAPARHARLARHATAACHVCDLAVPGSAPGDRCPRCGARLRVRQPHSIQRTWALVLCGILLLFPANLLPVLTIEQLGQEQSNTILGGVVELVRYGLWPLAVIVFTASIAIPLVKLVGLSWNLFLTHRGSARFLRSRTRMHRVIDWIGRWSNIDLFTVSLLVALVQFGELTRVRVESGMIAFAMVVIVTMVAAKSFDSRLMWDAAGERQ